MASNRHLAVDTDIGTDVDDLLTVALLPGFADAGITVPAITTVYGDTALRARLASVAASTFGLSTRIVAGRETPLSGRAVFWAGHEGDGVDGLGQATFDAETDAVDLLCELAREHDGELEILAIGPLTNLAGAILADARFPSLLRHVYVMGGDFGPSPRRPEHNFRSDALAAWVVLHSAVPLTVCGYDMTTRVIVGEADVAGLGSSAAGRLIVDQLHRFWDWLDATRHRPGLPSRASSPHDPMALLTAVQPELFDFEHVAIDIVGAGADEGMTTVRADPTGRTRIVRSVRTDEVKASILRRLAAVA